MGLQCLVPIVLGGLVPLAVAYSLGKLCFRRVPDMIAFGAGAVIESFLVFCLLAVGIATTPAFIALAVIGLAPLIWLRPRIRIPAPTGRPAIFFALIWAVYGGLYLIHSLTPEIQPDGVSYHLGQVAEFARLGRFPDRVDFFEMLPQGMEMLFLFAFAIGKHSAAKLVHFGFLLATIPLIFELGRRVQLPDVLSGAAATFYFCAPVIGITGSSTYNDAALVFFTLATLLALLLEEPVLAGLLAGFCYAIKMNGLLVPLLAGAYLLLARRSARPIRALAAMTAGALLSIAPWVIRNALVAGNPVAPLGNSFFPTQYFHVSMERELAHAWRYYDGFSFATAPWDLTAGYRLQGTFGPVFLLLPLGLVALRKPIGRWTWLAGALLAIPWLSNAGARFLMPSLPFFALALAMSLDMLGRPLLWVCLAIHSITCWPAVAATYQTPYAWRLQGIPWRAALRLEPEHDFLARSLWQYDLVDLLHNETRPQETTFAMLSVYNAYIDRPIVDWWESAAADRIMDTLRLASFYADVPFYDLTARWPAQALNGLRFRLNTPHPGEWDLNEIQLYSGADRIFNSPQWLLNAWPAPWDAPLAFDNNLASRWRTWEPMRPGMFFEVRFDHPQRLSSATLASHSPVYNVPVEFYGLGLDGKWRLLSANPERTLRAKQDLRRAATRFLKHSGIDCILAPVAESGVWQLGKILVEQEREWGLEDAGKAGPVHLLRIQR